MPVIQHEPKTKLPGRYADLVRTMAPQAIVDDAHYENTARMIDRLMVSGKLTRGQAWYMETLVQLAQAYDASRGEMDEPVKGVDALKHLLEENDMNAADLARLLGVHASMGSKLLKGDRALTVEHLKLLSARFTVRPDTFMD